MKYVYNHVHVGSHACIFSFNMCDPVHMELPLDNGAAFWSLNWYCVYLFIYCSDLNYLKVLPDEYKCINLQFEELNVSKLIIKRSNYSFSCNKWT